MDIKQGLASGKKNVQNIISLTDYIIVCEWVISCHDITVVLASPDASFGLAVACLKSTGFWIAVKRDVCHHGYVCTVLLSVQRPAVYIAVYSMCIIKTYWCQSMRLDHNANLWASFCCDIATI